MSSLSRARRVGRKVQFIKIAQERVHRIRQSRVSHYSTEKNASMKVHETETSDILDAGEKADEQKENTAVNTEPMPQILTSSLILSSVLPFVTPLGLVSVPATMLPSASGSLLDASPLPQSTEQKRSVSESLASSQSTTSASASVPSSRPSSMHFPPALLAFILIFACLFCVMMFLAFRRMCCRKQSRVQLPSPLFLGHTTPGLNPDRERSEPMELNKPKILARNTMVRFAQEHSELREESKGLSRNAQYMHHEGASFNVHLDSLNAPPAVHVPTTTPSESRRSRVLRPYVPRPYHRPHPAYTSDPDSVMPLIPGESFQSGDVQRTRSKDKGGHSRVPGGKENFMPGISAGSERSARSVDRPPRPLSILTEVIDSSNAVTGRKPKVSSSTSVNLWQYDASNLHSATVQPLPQSGTVAVDIGLAMLSGFSSPVVGLGFDPHSMSDTPLVTDQDHALKASKIADLSEGLLSQLTQSASSESDGLAYLASESSRSSMTRSMMDRYSVTQKDANFASVLEHRPDQEDHRAQAHARLVEQLNLAIDPDTHLPDPPVARFNPPFLPTLSEMALSHADPLYESVTNELFASYGVRMSTASGRMSRVSARISRMLSWIGDDAAPVERLSIGDGMSDEIEWISEGDRMSGVALGGGVQPLRIGKSRKSSA